MIRRLLLAALLVGATSFVGAQAWLAQAPVGGGGGYVGPCDTSVAGGGGCSVYYGLRAANAAKATALTSLADWACTNSGAFSGTLHSNSSGDANATELATITSDCGAQNVFATTIYEQLAGTANAVKVTNGIRLVLNSTTCKGLPLCFFGGSLAGSDRDVVSGTVSVAQAWTVVTVGCTTDTAIGWVAAKGSVWAAGFGNGTADLYAGNAIVTATASGCSGANNIHAVQYIANGASSAVVVDGTATTGLNAGTNTLANNFGIGDDDAGTGQLAGPFSELAVYPIALAAGSGAGQYGAVCHNQRLYWGTGGVC